MNIGGGNFSEITSGDVVTDGGYSYGCAWGDYDNDGDLDLFVANWNNENNFLYANNGDGTFTKVTSGDVVTDGGSSWGCTWGDYDNDGDLDLFVANYSNQNNFLYANNGNSNNWINIECTGVASNVSAIGSKVKVNATIGGDSVWQLREISGGTSSQESLNAEFGLGDATVIDEVQVIWPSGQTQVLPTVTPNQFLTITEPLLPAPTVLSTNPTTGTTLDDALNVTISGSDFYNGAIIELNFNSADAIAATGVTFVSGSELQCVFDLTGVSTHLGEGWDVKVTNPGGTFGIGEDIFTIYLPDPTVASSAPDTGTVGDTYLATITGTNFVSGASVKLTKSGETDINAIGVSVDSDTQITCSIDLTGAAVGAWDVVVTVPSAESPGILPGGFTVNAPPTFPEIHVKQDTTDIADEGSYDFGSQAVGSNTDVIFTIENLGTADLTISTPISITGTDSDQFSVQAQSTSPVAPAGSTTFTIRFSPTAEGTKSASIAIGNNDSDENPYDIALNGTATLPTIETSIGNGTRSYSIDGEGGDPIDDLGDGGAAASATLRFAIDVTFDSNGNIYIADMGNGRIRRVDAITNVITTFAGGGSPPDGLGDGGLATNAALNYPRGLAFDSQGNLFIADSHNSRIRRVDAITGVITTFAGGGSPPDGLGDGGLATNAALNYPYGVAVDSSNNVFIADNGNQRIRKVDVSTSIITTVAGNGIITGAVDGEGGDPTDDLGDGGLATSATLYLPYDVYLDTSGNLFIADNRNHRIRRVDASTGIITTVAGNGTVTGSIDGEGGDPTDDLGDGGAATSATLNNPTGVFVDSLGNLFISDRDTNRVRKVYYSSGDIYTIAGNGFRTGGIDGEGGDPRDDLGDGGPASTATLHSPYKLAIDASGNIFIADYYNYRIRKVIY